MLDYKEIEVVDDIDTLDGIPLEDGEKLEVIWPDYSHTFEHIYVKRWKNDEGGVCQKAHIILNWKSLPAKIRIVGLKARRETNEVNGISN